MKSRPCERAIKERWRPAVVRKTKDERLDFKFHELEQKLTDAVPAKVTNVLPARFR